MFAAASGAGKASSLNCGLWRERGTVRTSTNCVTPWATSNSMNASMGRVEWPTVSTLQRVSSAFSGSADEAVGRGDAAGRAVLRRRGALADNELADVAAQHGQEFIVEPGIDLEPGDVARRRMRQRDDAGRVCTPVSRRRCHRCMALAAQEMGLRILADEQGELDSRQLGEQAIEPQIGALAAWRQIAARSPPRVAVTHRQDRDARLVIEGVGIDAHPVAIHKRRLRGIAGHHGSASTPCSFSAETLRTSLTLHAPGRDRVWHADKMTRQYDLIANGNHGGAP